MVEYVVDFQGFRDDGKNFIIKELCMQKIENAKLVGVREHHLFLPPFDYKHLSNKKKKHTNWLKERLHGFSWNCGLQDYSELQTIFDKLSKIKRIYVKGSEKKLLLETQLNSYAGIIDIETLGCPSLNILKRQNVYSVNCPYKHNVNKCALNNVCYISDWLMYYWNSECDKHQKVKRLRCWDCVAQINKYV